MCLKCLADGNTKRHANPRWEETPRWTPPAREHGTYRGCRQHWCRAEELCDLCLEHYEVRRSILGPRFSRRKLATEKMIIHSLRLNVEEAQAVRELADEQGVNISQLLRKAVQAYLLIV